MVYILSASVIISLQRAKFQFLVFAFIMYNRFALHVKKKCIYERSLYGGGHTNKTLIEYFAH